MSYAVIHLLPLIPFLLLLKAVKPAIVDAIWKVYVSRVPGDIPDDGILDAAKFLQCTYPMGLIVIHHNASSTQNILQGSTKCYSCI